MGFYPVGGWRNSYELDLTAQSTGANWAGGGDGAVTVAGKTWSTVNTAASSPTFQIVNGTGLRIATNITSLYNTAGNHNGRSCPLITVPLSTLVSSFDIAKHDVRLWAYIAHNVSQNYDQCIIGFEKFSAGAFAEAAYGGYTFSTSLLGYGASCANGSDPGILADSANTTDDVFAVQLSNAGRGVSVWSGAWSSGWPTTAHLRHMALNTGGGFVSSADVKAVFGMFTNNGGAVGGHYLTVKRIKVELFTR